MGIVGIKDTIKKLARTHHVAQGNQKKKPHACSVCKKEGHNKLTCPDRDNAPDPNLAPHLSSDDTNTDDEEVYC